MKTSEKQPLTVVVVFTAIAFMLVGMFALLSSGDRALAAEGCCMKRQCPDDSCTWYVMQGDYDSCKKINDARDGDDVEAEEGLIWWSSNC